MVNTTSSTGHAGPGRPRRSRPEVEAPPEEPASDEEETSVSRSTRGAGARAEQHGEAGSEATSEDCQSVRSSEATSRSGTPTAGVEGGTSGGRGGRGGRRGGRGRGRRSYASTGGSGSGSHGSGGLAARQTRANYHCTGHWREDHGHPIFGVAVNHHLDDPLVFATVGNNRVTVYEALANGDNRLLQCYADPDADENFYTCAWSYDPEDGKPILAAAGELSTSDSFTACAGRHY
jgi:hypothetical protein